MKAQKLLRRAAACPRMQAWTAAQCRSVSSAGAAAAQAATATAPSTAAVAAAVAGTLAGPARTPFGRRALSGWAALCSAASFPSTSTSASLFVAGRRYQSTANRTKRALNVPPHPDFVGRPGRDTTVLGTVSSSSPAAAAASAATVLYNPPASAPSVYQTPFTFLPKSDPRRRANLVSLFAHTRTAEKPASAAGELPPALRPTAFARNASPASLTKRHHLTEADVEELRRLRASDPLEWSVLRLARKFECSPIFVMMAVQSTRAHQDQMRERVSAARQRWGPIRTQARADRVKRRQMLYSGEM